MLAPAHPHRGGISQVSSGLARAFRCEHKLAYFSYQSLYPSIFFPGTSQKVAKKAPWFEASDAILHPWKPWTWPGVLRRIRAFKPDLVVYQHWHPFQAVMAAALLKRLRTDGVFVVIVCHNPSPHEAMPFSASLTKRLLQQASAILVHGQSLVKAVEKIVPRVPVVVHPLPLPYHAQPLPAPSRELARKHLGIPDGPMILFFGLIRSYKGLDVLMRALSSISPSVRPLTWVAGEFYVPLKSYQDLAKELGLGKELVLRNQWVDDEDIPFLFAATDLVVMPYRDATSSGVVRMAQRFNRPLLVTSVGALGELIDEGRTGHVVPANDPAGLAQAIEKFFKDSEGAKMERVLLARTKSDDCLSLSRSIVALLKVPS